MLLEYAHIYIYICRYKLQNNELYNFGYFAYELNALKLYLKLTLHNIKTKGKFILTTENYYYFAQNYIK